MTKFIVNNRTDALKTDINLFLALINRAGGLYGRILTEVLSTDRTQWGLYHDRGQDSPIQTDLARLIRCLLYGKNKSNLTRFKQLVCTNCHFACERRRAEFDSSKVCSASSLFFFLISCLALTEINIFRRKQSIILHFSLQLFRFKTFPV